jgi:hypothetical protein
MFPARIERHTADMPEQTASEDRRAARPEDRNERGGEEV